MNTSVDTFYYGVVVGGGGTGTILGFGDDDDYVMCK
jgi:hypothetical protein